MEATIRQYDHSLYNQVREKASAPLQPGIAGKTIIPTQNGSWEIEQEASRSLDAPDATDIRITFRLLQGTAPQSSVAINLHKSNWSVSNFVFTPGSTYNGNRFESRLIAYSPRLMHPRDVGRDIPTIITDVPRLNIHDGPSRMQLTSGAATFPCMGFQEAGKGRGFLVTTSQGNALGDYGMDIEENRDRTRATFTLSSPHVREQYIYRIADNRYPSPDRGHDFNAGDTVVISFRLYAFDAMDITAFYNRYFSLHQQMVKNLSFTKSIPLSATYKMIEDKFNRMNWNPAGFYAMDALFDNRQWKPGWVSGMPGAYALWLAGNDTTRQRVAQQNNWAFPAAISPAGLFYEKCIDGHQWIGGDPTKFHTKDWHLVRSSADALFYSYRLLQQMRNDKWQARDSVKAFLQWENGVRRVSETFAGIWKKNGQFGQFVNSQTGDIIVGGSASGGIVPAALVLGYQYFRDSQYLAIAREAAEYFYQQFIRKGYTTGGPGDALQNPDSESCYGLLESFTLLMDVTGEEKWKQYAEETARQFATWVMPYHYSFPAQTTMGRLKAETGGTVWANTQNRHGAPGICTASGSALLKLYEATGNTAYIELLRVIALSIPQYLSRPDRPVGKIPAGCMDERVSTCDWLEGTGEPANLSTWAEISALLTAAELPGVYVEKHTGRTWTFDQVEARLVKKGKQQSLHLVNPTAFDAKVRLVFVNKTSKAGASSDRQEKLVLVKSNSSASIKIQ